ncbi:MAG: alpha/beta hydrolase [Xanthobacteraceae bacterium]
MLHLGDIAPGAFMAIDYEAEYNNRARVPEHPQIFARWEREAAAHRAETLKSSRAELGLAYGATPRQTIDVFDPAGEASALALFIHGGYWRSLAPSQFSHLAKGLNGHGVKVAVAGYDLCPQVAIGDIIAQMRQACLFLWRRYGRKILVYGHSAGGHLAACLLATDWPAVLPGAPRDLVPAAVAISGLFDLTPLTGVSMNADLRLSAAEARAVSPLFWPAPAGLILEAWCGALESGEFRRQNRIIAEAWAKAGVATACLEVPGTNHFTVVDPLADPGSELTGRLVALAQRARS